MPTQAEPLADPRAHVVRRPDPAQVWRTLRPARETSEPVSVVIVHPGALPAEVYGPLAERLSTDTGVHLLDLQGVREYQFAALTGGQTDLRIEAIAESFAERLRGELGVDERYVLIGWSFGGVLAHAMARYLTGPGAPAHLIVLDSIAAVPGYQAEVGDLSEQTLLAWFSMYLAAKRGVRPGRRGADPRDLAEVLDAMTGTGALLRGTSEAGLRKVYEAYVDGLRRNTVLTRDYQAPAGQIATTAVRARHSLLDEPGALGWDRIAPAGLQVLTGAGDHYSMLTDPATTVMLAELVHSIHRSTP